MAKKCILTRIQASVPDCTYHVDIGLESLKRTIKHYVLDLDPEYQRSYVWTEEQEVKYVGTLLENHNLIPPFWLNWTTKDFRHDSCEVVDGRQRIKASIRWLDGRQRIKASIRWLDGEILARCPCGIDVWHKDMDETSLRGLCMNVTMSWNFVDLDPIAVMKFYLRLNAGGTVHTPEELDRVQELVAKGPRPKRKGRKP